MSSARRLGAGPARLRRETFLVEGPRAIAEALGCLERAFITEAFAAREGGLVATLRRAGCEVLLVTEPVLAHLAGTVTPQGVVGVARLASPAVTDVLAAADLAVVLVGASDPGNLGTILRTADAAGTDAVVVCSGSVDPHNPKAVRASAGSLFHLPVARGLDPHRAVEACRTAGLRPIAVDGRGEVTHTEADLTGRSALLFGSEAHGLDEGLLAACDARVRVPIHGGAESLNLAAAAAVVLYEAARQRR